MFNYYILLLKKTAHTLIIMATGRTFIMIKPDGVHRRIVGEIIKRFENKGFKLVAMKFMQASVEHLEKHCADLSKKPFFDSKPGTIRGDFAVHVGRNICHESDAVESANHGIGLWFKPEKLVAWGSAQKDWLASCENIR